LPTPEFETHSLALEFLTVISVDELSELLSSKTFFYFETSELIFVVEVLFIMPVTDPTSTTTTTTNPQVFSSLKLFL
jgi:hypothetical protein